MEKYENKIRVGNYHLAVLSSPAFNFRWAYLYKNDHESKFIDNKENIILIGTPGAGKTHYSIGLVMKVMN